MLIMLWLIIYIVIKHVKEFGTTYHETMSLFLGDVYWKMRGWKVVSATDSQMVQEKNTYIERNKSKCAKDE